jgi:hypothetical protein
VRYRRLNPPSSQPLPEICAVIAFVGSRASGSFLGTPLRSRDPHPVHYFQPHSDPGHIGRCQQICQGQTITFGQQMDRAALALPAIGDILSPFLAGTKLPSRNAWRQSNLPCWSSRPKKVSQIRSQTPCSCHSWRRRWQVERLPYLGGKSFQRAPDLSTQRMPLRVRRSSTRCLPLRFGSGSNGSIRYNRQLR